MVGPGREAVSSVSAIRLRPATPPAQADEHPAPIAAARDVSDTSATFHFDGIVEGVPYPSLSPAQQDSFKADFFRELASVEAWSLREHWLPLPTTDLQVFVSDEYKIPKSLVPASLGQRGRMEFPAWKTVAGEAAITHELVHVFFPNGNRLLAEGLAVYLQAKIGGNPAFPNFGRPLHKSRANCCATWSPNSHGQAGKPGENPSLRP